MKVAELMEQGLTMSSVLAIEKLDVTFIDPKGNVWEVVPDTELSLNLATQSAALQIKRRK